MKIDVYYKISCDQCLKSIELYSSTKKECAQEAKRMGWIFLKKKNCCENCSK